MGIPSISEDGRRIAAVVAFMSACALWRLALTFSRLHDCCSREEGKKSSIYTSDPAAAATTRLPSQLFFFSLLFLFAALFSLSFFSFSSSELLQTYCMHACMHASKSCSSLFFSICSRLHQVIINMLLPAAAPYPSSSSPLFTSTISAKVRYTMRNKIVSSNRKTDRYLQISSFFIFGIADLLKTPTLRSWNYSPYFFRNYELMQSSCS